MYVFVFVFIVLLCYIIYFNEIIKAILKHLNLTQNIYINIQDSTDPSLLEYNLEDTSCWLPFLK